MEEAVIPGVAPTTSAVKPVSQTPIITPVSKKNKALRILIIIFVILFIFSIGTKIALSKFIFYKGLGYYEESIFPMASQLSILSTGKDINATSLEEFDELIEQTRQHIQTNYNRAKEGQPSKFYTFTQICTKNGVTKEINEITSDEFCYDGEGNIDCGNCTDLGFKETEIVNLSDPIIRYFSTSNLLQLAQNIADVTTKFYEEDEGMLGLVGATLTTIQSIGKTTIVFVDLIPMINGGYYANDEDNQNNKRTPYVDWDENSQEKLLKIEEFADRIPEVTEEQINALNFKDVCIDLYIETYKKSYTQDSFTAISYYFIDSRNFIPAFEDICELIEDNEKNLLLKNLKRSRVETIPTLKIIQKYHLGMIVDCPTLIYDPEARKKCTSYRENIQSLYDGIFGIVREEEN
jgi:hypothetical protein